MQDFVFVRKNNRYEMIQFTELIYVKAMRGYMQVVTENSVFFVLNTIEEVEKYLPKHLFCRIHRGYIVALKRIQWFDNWILLLKSPSDGKEYSPGPSRVKELPVGKTFRKNLKESVRIIPNRINKRTKRIISQVEFLLECVSEDETT